MYEMSNGPVNFDSDRLASLKCNPLSLDKYTNLSLSHDINPDSNFFSDTFNCEYYTESGLNGFIHENALNTEGLSLFHINIRSIRRNFSRLTNLLASINNKFSIIGISETWLQDSSHTVDIEGYNFVHNYRPDRSGGGVGLYLTTELEYKFRNDLVFPSQTCVESLFVEITNIKGKNIILGIVYRPPRQNVNDFNNNLNLLMGMISKENKFVIYSNSSGRRYETSNRIPGSGILSVKFDRIGKGAYLLSPNTVLKIPVEECGNRTSCESCVKGGDPYCGWCTLHATCTTYDKCPYYGSPLGYVRHSNECISISSLIPSSLPLSEPTIQKINICIVNLPVSEKKGAYGCSVNDVKMPSTLNGDTMECSVPTSSQLPEASSETGLVKAEVAVLSNETNTKIATAMLEFYNCSAISSCLKCTTGSLKCSWCHYKAECSADASSTCPESFASWKSKASEHECPLLDTQTFYIPGSVQRAITVRGTHFPKSKKSPDGEYQCTVSAGSQSYSIAATWNNSTSITCGAQEHKYPESSVEISANISVKLGKSDVKPISGYIQVYLYDCRRAATLCGSCLVAKAQYKCGWCVNTSSCSVNDGCPSGLWVHPSVECPEIPKIQSFYPKTGHVKGNSRLEINGTEFGRRYKDVKEVSIAGLQCTTIENDYVVAKRIVCLTSNSSKSLSAKIKVVIAHQTGLSKDEFHYQNPQVEDYEPKIGPISGGTNVTIYGKELDTGVDIQVFLGPSKCLNLSVAKTRMRCITSQFQNITRKRRSISNDEMLVVTFDGFPPVYGANVTSFKYVPDPVITDITPRITFPSSDRQINVTGSDLNGIHSPRIRLTFQDKTYVESVCGKPSYGNMICPFPNLTRTLTAHLQVELSFSLDAVTTWEVFSGYPKFKSMTIVPDPIITKFDDVFVLKTLTLEIKGKYLRVEGERDLLKYIITVGGEKCNITSIAQEVIYCNVPDGNSLPKQDSYNVLVDVSSSSLCFVVGELKYDVKQSTSSIIPFIVLGVGVSTLALAILILLIWYKRQGRTICNVRLRKVPLRQEVEDEANVSNHSYEEIEMDENGELLYVSSSTHDWEVERENIEIEKIIGKGSFGQVAKGILKDRAGRMDQVVAIKMIKENGSDREKDALLSELKIMKRLVEHSNVINLLGCVTKTEPYMVLITFVPNGDLLGYLRKSRGEDDKYFSDPDIKPSTDITSKHLISFARDIACGMHFLASNKVVHRDLAARNVLLDENLVCKVTDFGMARDVKYTDEIYTQTSRVRIPLKWTAIESLMYNKCTTSSDVWSYGIVLFEIFTIGGRPYPRMKAPRVYNLLKEGYRMPKPQHVDDELYSIMLQCWNSNPEERPSFSALKKIMSKMEMKHEVYVNLSLYSSSLYESMDLEED